MTDFLTFGAFFSLSLTLLILGILLIKKGFSHRLTPGTHYYIWFILFSGFILPFLPKISFNSFPSEASQMSAAASSISPSLSSNPAALQDFAVNAGHQLPQTIPVILILIWFTGVLVMLVGIFYSLFQCQRMQRRAKPVAIESLSHCEQMLGIKKTIQVKISPNLQGPVIVGTFRPSILLPPCWGNDLEFVLLHELVHYKHRDTLFNLFMHILLAVNWFNPIVWLAQKQMKADRESFCDSCVLNLLDSQRRIQYGHAVINWTAGFPSQLVGMGSSKKQLYSRIKKIAAYEKQTACKGLSFFVIIVMLLAAVRLVPSVHGFSNQLYQPEKGLRVAEENLQTYFDGYEGSFVLYNREKDHYTIYQEKASRTRVSANSTYKIYSALLALEKGTITKESSLRNWDGTAYEFQAWNRDQTLASALQNSVNWYFQDLDRESGKKALKDFYQKIGYGNCNVTGDLSDYWMEASLKISPLEQVMLLTDLYENKWGFSQDTVSPVKDALCISQENGVIFSGKTGTGMVNNRLVNGWFIGSVQRDGNLYTFALNLQGKDGASGAKAADIAREILKEKQILP